MGRQKPLDFLLPSMVWRKRIKQKLYVFIKANLIVRDSTNIGFKLIVPEICEEVYHAIENEIIAIVN